MAKEPQQQYDPEGNYEITLSRPVKRKGRTMSPMHRHTVKGKILAELPSEAIADVKPL